MSYEPLSRVIIHLLKTLHNIIISKWGNQIYKNFYLSEKKFAAENCSEIEKMLLFAGFGYSMFF